MKRKSIFSVIFATFLCLNLSQAQPNEQILVNKSDLPVEVLQKLEQQQKLQEVKQNMETAKEVASIGKEIGIAINDGLTAVTDQTVKFSQTTPGKFTMFLIAWKVMAKDAAYLTESVLGILIGVPLLLFFNFVFIWLWKRTTTKIKIDDGIDEKNKSIYSYEDTWYTKAVESDSDPATAFVVCWWVGIFICNIWLLAGVIF